MLPLLATFLCHPFYWQIFSLLEAPPLEVVDCGAHCGHFSILAEQCLSLRFGGARPHFTLIEPNPRILPLLDRNLRAAGLGDRAAVIHGILGTDTRPDATLWVSPANYLAASLTPLPGAKPFRVPSYALSQLVPPETRGGLLKMDIEGAEYACIERDPAILAQFQLVLVELHGEEGRRQQFMRRTCEQGFRLAGPPLEHAGHRLIALKNDSPLPLTRTNPQ